MSFVDADSVFQERYGLLAGQYILRFGLEKFRKQEALVLRELLEKPDPTVLATGGGAPLLALNRKRMREKGFVVWLDVPLDVLFWRMHSGDRPFYPKPISCEAMMEMLSTRLPCYREAHLRVQNESIDSSIEVIKSAFLKTPQRFY